MRHGSWLAAYLVLVCGAGQYAMGLAIVRFGRRPTTRCTWAYVVGWNGGNVAVVVGTLDTMPYLVDVGAIMLLLVLLGALRGALNWPASVMSDRFQGQTRRSRRIRGTAHVAYVALLVVLAGSIPVGLVLAHVRAV